MSHFLRSDKDLVYAMWWRNSCGQSFDGTPWARDDGAETLVNAVELGE